MDRVAKNDRKPDNSRSYGDLLVGFASAVATHLNGHFLLKLVEKSEANLKGCYLVIFYAVHALYSNSSLCEPSRASRNVSASGFR